MQQIRQYFEKLVTMTDTDWDLFSSGLNGRNLPKNSGSYRPSYSPAATDYGVVADSVFSADASGQHIRFGKAGEL
ncbi:hypothetical protein HNQ91_003533 [Filimonas zeae]|uniref:Uncharacterized protein n=1 Tax=Filimonas zeae TaxID=1737353 RepID=A0A917MX66_9BACT|nr:hypothetical protein [Filimonas zeae]MDR6340468.1 hypothetical protein [Filimonas zeae]GGH72881.1 hypothetical protein GCM10011379_33790 [Filimonas zeae]